MAGDSPEVTLSVVICTYNRPDLVAQVLDTVAQQDAPRDAYEVLVIDNASPADIETVVQRFAGRIPGLRCVREEKVGLSHARNRGWQEARGAYVAYVDDDCKLPPQWVGVALRIALDVRPVMFAGPAKAFYMSRKPAWFRDEYGSVSFADQAGLLTPDRTVSGMNMVVAKQALKQVGGFNPSLGMTGTTMAYGEETALQHAIREKYGPASIYYDPALYVYHLVRPEKMSVWWVMKRRFLGGAAAAMIDGDLRPRGVKAIATFSVCIRIFMAFVFDVIFHGVVRDRSRWPYIQNDVYEQASHRLGHLGRLWTALHYGRPSVGSYSTAPEP